MLAQSDNVKLPGGADIGLVESLHHPWHTIIEMVAHIDSSMAGMLSLVSTMWHIGF
jgi:hypothetical protein